MCCKSAKLGFFFNLSPPLSMEVIYVCPQGDEAAAAGADDANDVGAEGHLGVSRGRQAFHVGGHGGGAAADSLCG